jgi:hypothetical protein
MLFGIYQMITKFQLKLNKWEQKTKKFLEKMKNKGAFDLRETEN